MESYTFIGSGQHRAVSSNFRDLYQYNVFVGPTKVLTAPRNSYWYIDNNEVIVKTGDGADIDSKIICTEIFGYTPEKRTSTFSKLTDLPYVNGCSTKQLIFPNRPGDPTWQMLHMPPYTSEQIHHIHSTARVVYVSDGRGTAHMGQGEGIKNLDLAAGDLLILEKMVPHHFSTQQHGLTVLPLHIFSSTNGEFNHPMFDGTHKV